MKEFAFWGILFLGAVLTRVPVVGKFVRIANTLMHEGGHALVALLTGGGVVKMDLFSDTSGQAVTQSRFWIGKFLIALAGYTFASFFAFCSLFFIRYGNYYLVVYCLLFFAIVSLILWVRNKYGVFWILLFGALCLTVFYFGNYEVKYYFSVLLSGVLLSESLVSSIVILRVSFSEPDHSGDAANLSNFAFLPAFVWGLLFFAQALFWIGQAAMLYIN
jgi:hypothetical protein